MPFLGRSWPAPFLRPMWPFLVGGAITMYGVAVTQEAFLSADIYANDPRNPFKNKKPTSH